MKSNIKCVLFDLDNTLLPMNQELFFADYIDMFTDLFPINLEKEKIAKSILNSAIIMSKNDGSQTNESLFWANLSRELGDEVLQYKHNIEIIKIIKI